MSTLVRVANNTPKSAPKKVERRYRLFFYCSKFSKHRQYGDVGESKLLQTFLNDNSMDIEWQTKDTQEKLLELLQIEDPEIFNEQYKGKDLDHLVRFTYPNPKWTPAEEEKEFGCDEYEMSFMNCQRSELLEKIKEYRVSYKRCLNYKNSYESAVHLQETEPSYALWDDPVHIWVEEDAAKIGKTLKEFFDYALAGRTWGEEKEAIQRWNRRHGIVEEKKEEPKLTREELLEQDKKFLAQFNEAPKVQEKTISPEMQLSQNKLYNLFQEKYSEGVLESDLQNMPEKVRRTIAKIIDSGNAISASLFSEDALDWFVSEVVKRGDELPGAEEETEEDYSSLPDTFLTECVEEQEETEEDYSSLPDTFLTECVEEQEETEEDYSLLPDTFLTECVEEQEETEEDYSLLPDTFLTECVDEEEDEEDEETEEDYSLLPDTFLTECVDDMSESEVDEEDFTQETVAIQEQQYNPEANEITPQDIPLEIAATQIQEETTQTTEQPRAILRAAYGGAYFNFNPDFVGYGDQSSFKPALPEQEPEEAAAMSKVVTEHEQVSHHDSDVNEEDVKLEVVTEYEQVLHHDPGVNEIEKVTASSKAIAEYEQVSHHDSDVNSENETTASFEVITNHESCVHLWCGEKYTLVGDEDKFARNEGIEVDSPPPATYKVITAFELESVQISSIKKVTQPEPRNEVKPFRRMASWNECLYDSHRKSSNRHLVLEKPAKILSLRRKIPKIPIKLSSFRVNYPKTVPKPLKLSYKRLKIPSDTNSLYSYFHQRKGILRTECAIEKQLHQFSSKELEYISKEAKNRMPVLC